MGKRGRSEASLAVLLGCSFLAAFAAPTNASAQGEAYYFATAGIPAGEDSFVDRWCGPDMLPYTEDDIDLPERGNIGGTLGFSWIDSDGDGVLADEERIFVVIRRGDDDAQTFSTKSYPQYGVIAESEDWIDYHEARNRGPSATLLGDPQAEGNDFEHNDRGGRGEPGWEGPSNYYWYNNARADQRGWGGSKYYFEHQNGEGLDEMEGFNKWLSMSTNMDDPATPELDEDGPCKDTYVRSLAAVQRGLLIPVADIPGLADGDLDPLFGWYEGDMAKYVREVLGPKLEDESLTVYEAISGCAQSSLPPTHLMILQIECPIRINESRDCGDAAMAEAQAAYWGITPLVPGAPETAAIYRVSHVFLLNDEATRTDLGVPSFDLEPADGVARNLWVQDDFWRADAARIGRYVLGGSWSIVDDSSFDRGCGEADKYLQLANNSSGYFEAPLSAALDPAEGDITVVAEAAQLLVPPVAVDGATVFQIILLDEENVVAYAEFSAEGSSVNIGGSLDARGLATSPVARTPGGAPDLPNLDPAASVFTRFVLVASPAGVKLLQALSDEYTPNVYDSMGDHEVLASSTAGIPTAHVTAARVATSGGKGIRPTVDGLAVFSNLDPTPVQGGIFLRGDTNNDKKADISDGIFLLNHLFVGGPRWVCEEGADINDDTRKDLSDAVYLFGFLFLGGPAPPAPYPDCGADPNGETCAASKCNV